MSTLDYASADPTDEGPATSAWVAWAVYLAMSWTWCIGMFLPVLMELDTWGWLLFAAPNVIGAAIVGWVSRTRQQSRQIVDAHRGAMRAFSFVTATFQIFFAFWIFKRIGRPTPWLPASTVLLIAVATAIAQKMRNRAGPMIAFLVLIISVFGMSQMFRSGELMNPGDIFPNHTLSDVRNLFPLRMLQGRAGLAYLSWLAVNCLGFLTCPHLDYTFHRARQNMNRATARRAFAYGFGVLFLAMIAFTFLYSDFVQRTMLYPDSVTFRVGRWLTIYWVVQLGFTTGLHWLNPADNRWGGITLNAVATTGIGVALGLLTTGRQVSVLTSGMEDGEFIYEAFLGFYTFIFPTYCLICMFHKNWDAPTKKQLVICASAALLAAPFFWMPFFYVVHFPYSELDIFAGVAIILIARLFVRSPVQQ